MSLVLKSFILQKEGEHGENQIILRMVY